MAELTEGVAYVYEAFSYKALPTTPSDRRPPSPLLPPRKNSQGLPPTYLHHLRGLLNQWLTQQLAPDDGLPSATHTPHLSGRDGDERNLWTDERRKAIESAIWEGAVLPRRSASDGEPKGLLQVNWDHYALGSARRKTLWKRSQKLQTEGPTGDKLRKAGVSGLESNDRSRLGTSLPSSTPASGTSTPIGKETRSPSLASHKELKNETTAESSKAGSIRREREDSPRSDEDLQRWSETVQKLHGFQRYRSTKKDEWDVVNDTVSPPDHRELPGSFPQGNQFDRHYHSQPNKSTTSLARPVLTNEDTISAPNECLKPIFSLHFPSSTSHMDRQASTGSTSTIRLRRDSSLGNQGGNSWWSQRRGSEHIVHESKNGNIQVEFIEGLFALPPVERPSRKSHHEDRGIGGSRSVVEDGMSSSDEDDNDGSSVWSGTQRATSTIRGSAWTTILSGGNIDFVIKQDTRPEEKSSEIRKADPTYEVGSKAEDSVDHGDVDTVRLAGGTIVFKGVESIIERQALEKIFRVLLYTIQSMHLELALLDAFRIPREPDAPPPTPAKPQIPSRSTGTVNSSSDRRSSVAAGDGLRKKKEGSGGLFHRLGREGKGVWDGLIGKRRDSGGRRESVIGSSSSHNTFLSSSSSGATTTSSSYLESASEPSSPLSSNVELDQPAARSGAPGHTIQSFNGQTPLPNIQLPIERHLQILTKLEGNLHSTTPNLRFDIPPILQRVKAENELRNKKAEEEITSVTPSIEGLPASSRSTRPDAEKKGRAMGYRLGGDVRAGLGVLVGGIEGFEGWMRLQKLETLISIGTNLPSSSDSQNNLADIKDKAEEKDNSEEDLGVKAKQSNTSKSQMRICRMPKSETLLFYDQEGRDQTLREFCESLSTSSECQLDDEMESGYETVNVGCGRKECEVPLSDHERWWYHAGRKVVIRTNPIQSLEQSGVGVWVQCADYLERTKPKMLNGIAEVYSWAKFLELVIYSNFLVPTALCSHSATSGNQSFSYHLQISKTCLVVTVEKVPILDIRLPMLQVGPNVSKRKSGRGGAEAMQEGLKKKKRAVDGVHLGEVDGDDSATLKSEIEVFFVGLEARVAALKQHVLPKTPFTANAHQVDDETGTADPVATLSIMMVDSRLDEARLYNALASTPKSQLNDVRRQFSAIIKKSTIEISAWVEQNSIEEQPEKLRSDLPAWASNGKIHALPGSSVLVHEDEPSSVIAYTLSSLAYFEALTCSASNNIKDGQTSSVSEPSEAGLPAESEGDVSEQWAATITRLDTPRDLLSLRSLAKKKSNASIGLTSSRLPMSLTPAPNAPSLEVSLEQVEGKSQASDRLGDLVKNISKATAQDPILTYKRSSPPSLSEAELESAPSILTTTPRRSSSRYSSSIDGGAPPPSAFKSRAVSSTLPLSPTKSTDSALTIDSRPKTPAGSFAGREGWSSVTSSLGSSFTHLIKLGSDVGDSLGSFKLRSNDRSLSALIGPLSIKSNLDTSMASFDDRPHIDFNYTIGERLKLGCTVYFATAFDGLRRRCAIDKSIIASLSRSSSWNAQGGKSKATFFITSDKRYIVKELVNKWNVSDTHALLEIAPAYFEHLAGTHNKATSLAKIVGFYSVRTHDLQSGTKRELNLLVMENLFYKHAIAKTYDLKGIEGRRAAKGNGSTSFDGEWLDSMRRAPIFLHPHAKRILHEAIVNDTRFLSSQSIMDYSLLLGLDASRNELVAGLVDAIGSYNLFKTIESRSKLALNRGGDVTIIPPDQYRDRFETALRQYFIACPDKWSRVARRSGTAALTSETLPCVL